LRHGAYDEATNFKKLNPVDLSSFDDAIGARDAIDKCTELAKFYKARERWEPNVKEYVQGVFLLGENVTPSDTLVE
jgi:hypothetical protein